MAKSITQPLRSLGVAYSTWDQIPLFPVRLKLESEGWHGCTLALRFGCCITYKKGLRTCFFVPEVPDRVFSGSELMAWLGEHWHPSNPKDQEFFNLYCCQ